MPVWYSLEIKFLTTALDLHCNPKWQELIAELQPAEPSSPAQLGIAGASGRRPPQLKPSA